MRTEFEIRTYHTDNKIESMVYNTAYNKMHNSTTTVEK